MTKQEELGKIILSLKDDFPNLTASQRADLADDLMKFPDLSGRDQGRTIHAANGIA